MKPDSRKVIDARLWAMVAATVRPLPGRIAELPEARFRLAPTIPRVLEAAGQAPGKPISPPRPAPRESAPQAIEPGLHRRLVRVRGEPAPTIDLHGLDQDGARRVLTDFVLRAHADGARMLLVITGKGVRGDGVLRRRTPEWLAEPPLRAVIAGLSQAHRRHGGEGALYLVLRRRACPRV